MPQRPRLVEVLHPDRRPVAEGVDRVVVGHREVPEDGAPEADVDQAGVRGHGELDLLHGSPVGGGSVRPRDVRDRSRELDVALLEVPDVAGQPDGEAVVGERQQHPARSMPDTRATASASRAASTRDVYAERRRRPAVQDDPVVDALGGEELLPPLLAHGSIARSSASCPGSRWVALETRSGSK